MKPSVPWACLWNTASARAALLEEAGSVPPELPAGRREKAEAIFARVRSEGRVNLVET